MACKVDDMQGLFFGISDRICRAARISIQIADTMPAVVNHKTVPCVHTAFIVMLGKTDCFVGKGNQLVVFLLLPSGEIPALPPVRNCHDEPEAMPLP